MKLIPLVALAALLLGTSISFAQSAGTGAGASAGGSSASGGPAASSTTVGSSMNGSTQGNNGRSEGLSRSNSTNMGPPSNAVGSSATTPGANGGEPAVVAPTER